MAKQRMINTKFWSDPWVMTKCNPLDRLLFLYLITNELTNISGIYEISEHRIAFDTGIDKETLIKAMLPRLEPKVYYKDNWVVLTNFCKHQNLKSADVVLGIKREFELAPEHVKKLALRGGWGEGLGMMPDTKPNLTKLTSDKIAKNMKKNTFGSYNEKNSEDSFEDVVDNDTGEIQKSKPRIKKQSLEVFALWGNYPKVWIVNKTQRASADRLALLGMDKVKKALDFYSENKDHEFIPQILSPFDLETKWQKLFAFKKKNNL